MADINIPDDDDTDKDYPDAVDAFKKKSPDSKPEDIEREEFDRDVQRRLAAKPAEETVREWENAHNAIAEGSSHFIDVAETRNQLTTLRITLTALAQKSENNGFLDDVSAYYAIRSIVEVYDRCHPTDGIMATDAWFDEFQKVAKVSTFHLTVITIEVLKRKLPDWLVRLVGLFDNEVRGQLFELGKVRRPSSAKAQKDLGWSYRPWEDTLVDTATSLEAVGAV